MPHAESTMLPLGTPAPDFTLRRVRTNEKVTLQMVTGPKGLLVMFICRHCPFVAHIQNGLAELGRDERYRDIGIVAISSNDIDDYPDDAPGSLAEQALELGFTFPYLYDETQEVARAYRAACTPDFFLFDSSLRLVYRGQFDDSRPHSRIPVTGKDLRAAMDALIAGTPISTDQIPSVGCNIKWKRHH